MYRKIITHKYSLWAECRILAVRILTTTQPLVKMSTRNIPGGKGGRCVRLTTSPPSRAECHEIWEPKPPGTLWATPGLLLDCFTLHILTTRLWKVKTQYSFQKPCCIGWNFENSLPTRNYKILILGFVDFMKTVIWIAPYISCASEPYRTLRCDIPVVF